MGPPLFLLVPEQVSYAMEKELLAEGVEATTRARVLSFRRLQEWMSAQTPGAVRPALNDVHTRALLTRILSEARRKRTSSLLKVNGLERSVTALVQEFEEYQVNAEVLNNWAAQAAGKNNLLAAKLRELALIAEEFQRLTKDRFETAEDSRQRLERAVQGLDFLQGATLYIDSFDGFGPQEKELLKRLLPLFRSVAVALTIPAEDFRAAKYRSPDSLSLYYPVAETSRWFWETFHGEGEQAKVLEFPQLGQSPHLARTLASLRDAFLQQAPAGVAGEEQSLKLIETLTPRDEVRQAVAQLLEWSRAGWAWSEMGIVTRSLSPYAQMLKHELERIGIPFFLDRLEPVENESLLYGLEALVSLLLKGWSAERFGLFVKSRFCESDLFNRTRFLDYMSATRKGEADLYNAASWLGLPNRDPEADEQDQAELPFESSVIREDVLLRYLGWRGKCNSLEMIAPEGDRVVEVKGFLALLVEVLQSFPIETERDEYLLKQIGLALQSLFEVCGEERLEPLVLNDLITDTLKQMTLPHIPPHLNEVLIGQVDRSRYHNLRGAIVLGFNDNVFPKFTANATLLTDEEREFVEELSGSDEPLAPSARKLLAKENFYAYKALTRAREACVVLRSQTDFEGQASTASPYWIELLRLFSWENLDLSIATKPLFTLEGAASEIARHTASNKGHFHATLTHEQQQRWNAIQRIITDRNSPRLSSRSVQTLFGGGFQTSVSQLESFGNCPFQFFVKRTLRPEQPFSPSINIMDFGQYSHALVSRLIASTEGYSANFFALSPEELRIETANQLQSLQQEYVRKGLLNTALQRLQLSTLDDSIQLWVGRLQGLLRELHATEMQTEIPFGKKHPTGTLSLNLKTPQGIEVELSFRGRIDFLATVHLSPTARAVLVVDFKLSERTIRWQNVLLGRELQLPLYHQVAYQLASDGSSPTNQKEIAALYIPIQDKHKQSINVTGIASDVFSDAFNHNAEAAVQGSENQTPYKFTGGLSATYYSKLIEKTPQLLTEIGNEILTGNTEVAPSRIGNQTACTYCDFIRACRLDYTMNRPRHVASRRNDDVLEEWLNPPII